MKMKKKTILSWCLFDFGQTAFSTVIVTFVFSTYFAKMVMPSEIIGISNWGFALSFSGLLIALLSPTLGAIADASRSRKPWLTAFTLLSCVSVSLLFFIKPDPHFGFLALGFFALSNTFVEINQVFYNAYLPQIAPHKTIGKISGYGWGSGYLGGLLALIIVLTVYIQSGLFSQNEAFNIRLSTLFVAVWMLLFALPLIFLVKDSSFIPTKRKGGLVALLHTFREIKKHRLIFRFLVARIIYIDGLNTLLTLGGVFASIVFSMGFEELLYFGIAMNLTAGLGAFLLARLDDRMGSSRLIVLSLLAILFIGIFILTTHAKWIFWLSCLIMSLFIGPLQSASRSLMAHLAPKDMRAEMFGFYALSGKVTSFIGPLLVGLIARIYESERLGMTSLFVLMATGLILMIPVVRHARNT